MEKEIKHPFPSGKGVIYDLDHSHIFPINALKYIFTLNPCPASSVWARNMFATARTMNTAVAARRINATHGCHQSTPPDERRVIIATGEVNGNRLNPVAIAPCGSWAKTVLEKNSGIIIGIRMIKVAWDASRRLGARAPNPDIRLAYTA